MTVETTPIYARVAATVPHPFDPGPFFGTTRIIYCRKCGKTTRARIHQKEN